MTTFTDIQAAIEEAQYLYEMTRKHHCLIQSSGFINVIEHLVPEWHVMWSTRT